MAAEFPQDLSRVAMYLRKSRADFEAEARGEGETLSKHRKALMEVVKRNRLNVVTIREEIVSGERISDRPEMMRLLKEVEAGEYDAVLCMDIDRLGRGDMIDQGTILAAFKSTSTLIITPRKVYDLDDELDEEWSEFEAFMARRELKIITKRLQRGRVMAVKEGKFIGTHPPFGYDKGPDGILIPSKDAEIVKLIFHWYVHGDGGDSMGSTKIKDRLNEMGIKSPIWGKAWEPSTVLAILQNEVYIGRIQWRKSFRDKPRKKGHIRPRDQWIDVLGKHQPLIDEAVFHAAQKIMQGRRNRPTNKQAKNPLAGLIVCGKCGKRMILQGGRQGRVQMCKCITSGCDNKSSSFRFVEDRLLNTIEEELRRLELDQERVSAEIAVTAEPIIPSSVVNELESQLAELQKQRSSLQDLLEKGIYDIPTYLERNQLITERIEATKRSLEQTKAEIETAMERARTQHEIIPTIRTILDAYRATNDISEKNSLLKQIVDHAVYLKEKSAKLDNFALEVHFSL